VLVAQLAVAVAAVVVIVAVAWLGYGVAAPRQLGRFVVAVLFAAAVAPNAGTARGVGAILFYLMMFFAGLWLPIPSMPRAL
jgi:ABC-2 type transport system permease protein